MLLTAGTSLLLFYKISQAKPLDHSFKPVSSKEDLNTQQIVEYHPHNTLLNKEPYVDINTHLLYHKNPLTLYKQSTHRDPQGSESFNNMFQELSSWHINTLDLSREINNHLHPYLLLTQNFKWSPHITTLYPKSNLTSFKVDHLLNAKSLTLVKNQYIHSADINIENKKWELYLKLSLTQKTDELKLTFLLKKPPEELVYSILNTPHLISPIPIIPTSHLTSKLFLSNKDLPEIIDERLINPDPQFWAHLSSDTNNDIPRSAKISTNLTQSGFLPSSIPNHPLPNFYFQQGKDLTQHQLFDDPHKVFNAPFKGNIFTSETYNPHNIGGYIINEFANPKRITQKVSNIDECFSTPTNKLSCEYLEQYKYISNTIDPPTPTVNTSTLITNRPYYSNIDSMFEPQYHLKYDLPNPNHYIHPFIANKYYQYYQYPQHSPYQDIWSLPKLSPQILQSILEQKTQSFNHDLKPTKEPQPSSDPLTFPLYFTKSADFRTWSTKDLPLDQTPMGSNNFNPTYEGDLSTTHTFSIILLKQDWQKHLLPNSTESSDPLIQSGLHIFIPTNFTIFDPADNFEWEQNINITNTFNLSDFKTTNTLYQNQLTPFFNTKNLYYTRPDLVTVIKRNDSDWTPLLTKEEAIDQDLHPDNLKLTKITLNPKLSTKAHIDEDHNLVFTYNLTLNSFINTRNNYCDSRDWDIFSTIQDSTLYQCPIYQKLPSTLSFTIKQTPTLTPYWFNNESVKETMSSYLYEDNLDSRKLDKILFLKAIDTQSKFFTDLRPKGSKDEDKVEESCDEKSYWFADTPKRFITYFGINQLLNKKDHWTLFNTSNPSPSAYLEIGIEPNDLSEVGLIINKKHHHTSALSIWTNEVIDSLNKTPNSFINQHYSISSVDKPYTEILKDYAQSTSLSIKISEISSDPNKPTYIPFRLALSSFKDTKHTSLYPNLEEVATYVIDKDQDFKRSDIKGPNSLNPLITSWAKETKIQKNLADKNSSFAFSSFGFFAYKTQKDNQTQIYIKSKLWSVSYSYQLNTYLKVLTHGSKGASGFYLTYLKVKD